MTGNVTLPSDQEASGRSLGEAELAALAAVIGSGTLTSTKGSAVAALEAAFAAELGVRHAIACASGSAAIHCAVAAIDQEPGDEIVTTAITDMGALTPILYQGAIPVFADVDPRSGNVTAETVAARLGPRTRAIVATHLFGNPCDMPALLALADRHGIPLIEDAAQALGADIAGRPAGSLGRIGCFSLQQGKHMTCGEGGLVVTNDDALARRIRLFVNKGWGYGDAAPDHEFLALNYRMSELQGAVAGAQLPKLAAGVAQRIAMAARLDDRLGNRPGIALPAALPGARHSYWRYCLAVDPARVPGGAVALGRALRDQGIAAAPRYIQKPAFQCRVFAERRTFGSSQYPFTLARPEAIDYAPARFPGTFAMLAAALVLPWNEGFRPAHVDHIARSVDAALAALAAA